MNELKNFGINPLTKKEIVWTNAYENKAFRDGNWYMVSTFISDVLAIYSIEDYQALLESNTEFETDVFDKLVMPSLNLQQQEMVVKNKLLKEYIYSKPPKRIGQILSCPSPWDITKESKWLCVNPTTKESMPFVSRLTYKESSATLYSGTVHITYHFGYKTDSEKVRNNLGSDYIAIVVKYSVFNEYTE